MQVIFFGSAEYALQVFQGYAEQMVESDKLNEEEGRLHPELKESRRLL